MADKDKTRALNPAFVASQGRFARDREAAREAGKKGGAALQDMGRRRRKLRDALGTLLAMPVDEAAPVETVARAADVLRALGVEDPTGADAVALAQFVKAVAGDTEAARYVRDTAGERPADQVSIIPGELVDADSVAQLTDAELAELAGNVAPDVALPAPDEPQTVAAQGIEGS